MGLVSSSMVVGVADVRLWLKTRETSRFSLSTISRDRLSESEVVRKVG